MNEQPKITLRLAGSNYCRVVTYTTVDFDGLGVVYLEMARRRSLASSLLKLTGLMTTYFNFHPTNAYKTANVCTRPPALRLRKA